MKNKIIPLLSLTKRDYKPKRILSQPKPVSIIPTKTYNNELTEIYNSLYEDFFPLILRHRNIYKLTISIKNKRRFIKKI